VRVDFQVSSSFALHVVVGEFADRSFREETVDGDEKFVSHVTLFKPSVCRFGDGLCRDNSNHVAGEARPAWWCGENVFGVEPFVSNLYEKSFGRELSATYVQWSSSYRREL
jgi:hypothetical protein